MSTINDIMAAARQLQCTAYKVTDNEKKLPAASLGTFVAGFQSIGEAEQFAASHKGEIRNGHKTSDLNYMFLEAELVPRAKLFFIKEEVYYYTGVFFTPAS
jgi:hypothetical protein